MPRTANRVRDSGRRRRAGARLLLAGDHPVEDVLGIIHYCRLTDLLRVVCDEGGRARHSHGKETPVKGATHIKHLSGGLH